MLLVALILLPGLSCGALSTERVYCPAAGGQRLCEQTSCPHAGHPHVHYRVAEAQARPESPAALLPAASAPQQSAPAPRPLSVLRPAVQSPRSRAPDERCCLCLPLLL
ncbi:MAG: hypothetical protein ACI4P8_00665 [Akkermansia sp.]